MTFFVRHDIMSYRLLLVMSHFINKLT